MHEITLVFPHQLFTAHPAAEKKRPIYLVEEWLFFRQYNFHKKKLLLHRAAMKYYESHLKRHHHEVHYIECGSHRADVRQFIAHLAKEKLKHIYIADVADDWLTRRINESCKAHKVALTILPSPNFLNTAATTDSFFANKTKYFQTDFYIQQRKDRMLLVGADGSPAGGKWSFDAENRVKFPKAREIPPAPFPDENEFIKEAINYVENHFSDNYGSTDPPYFFACTHKEAEECLHNFMKHRLQHFGTYEDAIVAKEHILHHSVLTPMLNIGLLSPQQVLDAVLKYAAKKEVPLNSLEGFVRQIAGWREFIKIVYTREGPKQRTTNFWQFTRKLPPSFWTGDTGIVPIDVTIKKVLATGYCHHIERLMVLGNFMLLCEFDPDEVHRWFMEMFIDAYDWVMVPNVYGMTQFADGGLMTTKPYISGSNYLSKMGDYEKGEWQQIWDGLFWRFMHVHRNFFTSNPRLGMLVGTFDKMHPAKKSAHLNNADNFLAAL